jgi:hypothetical protein
MIEPPGRQGRQKKDSAEGKMEKHHLRGTTLLDWRRLLPENSEPIPLRPGVLAVNKSVPFPAVESRERSARRRDQERRTRGASSRATLPFRKTRTEPEVCDTTMAIAVESREIPAAAMCLAPRPSGTSTSFRSSKFK